jgi:3-hydroxyisobutyrate dehydrogenase-like beta-hydroxyacid dehydrogenase
MSEKVAVIGLGLIGKAWAEHLAADGVLSAAWNRTFKSEIRSSIHTLSEVPTHAELLHVCVSDESTLLSVLSEFVNELTSEHTVIQSTTIDPATSDKARALVEGRGALYVEAPFTGSLPAAKERKTIFFVGAKKSIAAKVDPYLARLSSERFLIGDNRQACSIKLAMNLQIASAMAALSEALTISRRSGISDDVFFAVFKKNASYSGLAALKEKKLQENDFQPQFSVKHMAKDLRLLRQEYSYPLLQVVSSALAHAEENGLGDLDFSAIIKTL